MGFKEGKTLALVVLILFALLDGRAALAMARKPSGEAVMAAASKQPQAQQTAVKYVVPWTAKMTGSVFGPYSPGAKYKIPSTGGQDGGSPPPPAPPCTITPVAGNGTCSYDSSNGDGGQATDASLCFSLNNDNGLPNLNGIAVDKSGNLYISDMYHNMIRKVGVDGKISTVKGPSYYLWPDGRYDWTNWPTGLAFDSAGNLYIGSYDRNTVQKIDQAGAICTVILYGSQTTGQPLPCLPWSGPDSALSTSSTDKLYVSNVSEGLVVDNAGGLYFTNGGMDILKVDQSGVTLFAGSSPTYTTVQPAIKNAQLMQPTGLAFDANGRLYVADSGNNVIQRLSNGHIDAFALNMSLNKPTGLAFDANGRLYIADSGNNRILRVDITVDSAGMEKDVISTFVGSTAGSGVLDAALNRPTGLAFDADGNLYFADSGNNKIKKVTCPSP